MSVEALVLVLHHSKASGTAKLVLIGIANHQGDGGSWPAVSTLAKYANVIPRNVQKSIQHLVDLGEVEVTQRPGKSACYRVLVRCPDGCDRSLEHRVTPVASDTPVVNDTPVACDTPVTDDTPVASDANPRRMRRDTPVASDTRTTLEPEENLFGSSQAPSPGPKPKGKTRTAGRGTRIPDGWLPDPEVRKAIVRQFPGLPDEWWRAEHENFTDWHIAAPGQKGVKVDWNAAWRGWMRRAEKPTPGRGGSRWQNQQQAPAPGASVWDKTPVRPERRLA